MLDMHGRPSDLMGIEDAYTAFCFDEACAFIISQLTEGKEPKFKKNSDGSKRKVKYSRPSELYSKFNK